MFENLVIEGVPIENGRLISAKGSATFYLVDQQKKRGYTSLQSFLRIHRRDALVFQLPPEIVNAIPNETVMPRDAELITSRDTATVYLLDADGKRGIPSQAVFRKYQFGPIKTINDRILDLINRSPRGTIR